VGRGRFSEALRQEALHSNIRVTIVEPGFVETELQGHNEIPAVREAIENMREQMGEVLQAEDIARSIRVFAAASAMSLAAAVVTAWTLSRVLR